MIRFVRVRAADRFLHPRRTSLKGNWDTMGLRGTESFDYEVPEQFVEVGSTWGMNTG